MEPSVIGRTGSSSVAIRPAKKREGTESRDIARDFGLAASHRRIVISLVAGTLRSAAAFSIAAASSGASTSPSQTALLPTRPAGQHRCRAPPGNLSARSIQFGTPD
jgi:hypothetical protein